MIGHLDADCFYASISTCGEFRLADRRLIRQLLTVKGESLWFELRGEAVTPIATVLPMHKALPEGEASARQLPICGDFKLGSCGT